jgi:acylphosphatase
MVVRRRVVVSGEVQGVGFRWACAREATAAGVHGEVRNRDDGGVEVVVEGDAGAVERVVAWARQGPSHAHVSRAEVTDEEPEGLAGFRIVR